MRNKRLLISTVMMWSALSFVNAQAQASRSVWDGVYTDAQAARGLTQYMQHCALCHAANLSGTYETPPLTGRFIPYWSGATLDKLLDYINTAMPEDRPGSVNREADVDILAFILKTNNFPSGQTEINAGALKEITFDAVKPQPIAAAKGQRR